MAAMKCIWMTSGLVAYKLCSHYYRCDSCIFDRVMRGGEEAAEILFPGTAEPDEIHMPDGPPAPEINGALFYHRNHCWIRVEDLETVTIGIDGLMASLVSGMKAVTLPGTGETIAKGGCFSHIILNKHIVELISPLSGSFSSVNYSLLDKPGLLASDCWDSGWLVTMKPSNLEQDLRRMIFGKRAAQWYGKRKRELNEACHVFLNQDRDGLGLTMQDGGERISNIAEALTESQFFKILELLSRPDDFI